MYESNLKEHLVNRILMRVEMPAQYIGGEWNMVRKDPRSVRGRLCLAFPDAYTIGMSHHGLQVLYSLMNARDDWYCERVFTPWPDMEDRLREAGLPLYSLETFTPLAEFDVLGFSLQYEICYTNLLTMLDLGGIPLRADQRTMHHPLVIAGGPCTQNPEPLAPFIDVFVTGDGEPSLPQLCDLWKELRTACWAEGGGGGPKRRGGSSESKCWPRSRRGCRSPTSRGSTSRSISRAVSSGFTAPAPRSRKRSPPA